MNTILDELKKRCNGYLGQFYQLIKPINHKYDISVKVSLLKQLKFLVVDTVASFQYVIQFLKEKEIQKDVLVLENIPQKKDKDLDISLQKLADNGCEKIRDVID